MGMHITSIYELLRILKNAEYWDDEGEAVITYARFEEICVMREISLDNRRIKSLWKTLLVTKAFRRANGNTYVVKLDVIDALLTSRTWGI